VYSSHLGQLGLAIPLWGGAVGTSNSWGTNRDNAQCITLVWAYRNTAPTVYNTWYNVNIIPNANPTHPIDPTNPNPNHNPGIQCHHTVLQCGISIYWPHLRGLAVLDGAWLRTNKTEISATQ